MTHKHTEIKPDAKWTQAASALRKLVVAALCLTLISACAEKDPVVLFDNGDFDAAFPLFQARANDGDIIASNYLGMHYYLGVGAERDFKLAAKWFEVAALAEHPGAQRNLGVMYLRGLGVEQDAHQAFGWLHFAYKGGNKGAREYLELMSDRVTPNAGGVARRKVQQKIAAAAAVRQQRATAGE